MSDTLRFSSVPVAGPIVITSGWGRRTHPTKGTPDYHRAIDIRARLRDGVLAVMDGTVIRYGEISEACGFGIEIGHDRTSPQQYKYTTTYCHFLPTELLEAGAEFKKTLEPGQRVKAGQMVGRVGTSGNTTAPHVHFILKEHKGRVARSGGGGGWYVDDLGYTPIDPTEYIKEVATRTNVTFNTLATAPPPPPSATAISPNIGLMESFHPRIQRELTKRRLSANTATVYMPFVKLTSLSKVLGKHLENKRENDRANTGVYFPSLGIHGQSTESFEDIYSSVGNRSHIGYAIDSTTNGTSVKVLVEASAEENTDQAKVPIPGIISAKAERSTAGPMGVRGGLMKMDLTIRAYSKGQLDALLVYFLRPATRLVLEFGRISSNSEEEFNFYNWKKPLHEIVGPQDGNNTAETPSGDFARLLVDRKFQQEFANEYVYKSNGNYEIFLGYVVKFNINYTKDNVYEIDLTMHSVQQYEVPTVHTAVKSSCPGSTGDCDVIDIREYFDEKTAWKNNTFSKLMEESVDSYASDVISLKDSNTATAASTPNDNTPNEYYVTWRFFIEQILGNANLGIASMLGGNTRLTQLSLPRIVREPTTKEVSDSKRTLMANQVGYHPALKSTNPGVMLIYNSSITDEELIALEKNYQQAASAVDANNVSESTDTSRTPDSVPLTSHVLDAIKQSPKFTELVITEEGKSPTVVNGAALLTSGVWLHTAAIKQAFTSTDTISSGINAVLNMMNAATEGYWNLQLYSTDSGMYVIDMGLSKTPKIVETSPKKADWIQKDEAFIKNINDVNNLTTYVGNSDAADENLSQYLYMFNRKFKFLQDGELGSDLIDLKVEFNMPQVIAVQAIANIGGSAQKSLLQSIDIEELQSISLLNNLYNVCDNSDICGSDTRCGGTLADVNITTQAALYAERANKGNEKGAEEALQQWRRLRAERYLRLNPHLAKLVGENRQTGTALALIESNPGSMMKSLNIDSEADRAKGQSSIRYHAFNSSNLTKTIADVTLPGIGGIELFQAFLVDRAPSILDKGFYVVTKVNHEFESNSGWITKIQGRFRFRPDGETAPPTVDCGQTTTSAPATTTSAPARANSATAPMARRPLPSIFGTVPNFGTNSITNPNFEFNDKPKQFEIPIIPPTP